MRWRSLAIVFLNTNFLMEDKNLNELLNDGFPINQGHLFERILLDLSINQVLLSDILRRILKLENSVHELGSDDEQLLEQYSEICDLIAERGTQKKNQILSELFSKSSD